MNLLDMLKSVNIFETLKGWIDRYDIWVYAILFLIVFVETGLVVMPLLPGDSLLFAAGAFAADGTLSLLGLYLLFFCAALLGDNVNYGLGSYFGPKVFKGESGRFFKREHLEKTRTFYDKYGGKTVIMARFVPIVRTFAPFVAGIGSMKYAKFISYSVVGALLWVGICVTAGYQFGAIPIVRKRFELVAIAIVLISVLPMVFEYVQHRRKAKKEASA